MTARILPRACLVVAAVCTVATVALPDTFTGRQFVAVTNFANFEIKTCPAAAAVLTSPIFQTHFDFNQIVVSWNVEPAADASIVVQLQPIFHERPGKFYTMGRWSPQNSDRRSVPHQADPDAEIQTDVVLLAQPARQCRLRLTLVPGETREPTTLKFLGLSLLDTSASPAATPVSIESPRDPLPVPTRSQLDYPGGDAWCSPTSLSMVLSYWATQLNRRDLDLDVPEVAAGVDDPGWPGTGNWSFNTAYAGSFPGMRGYVTRLGSVDELQPWIAAGVPVVASVTYSILKGLPDQGDGHLVVVVGFDANGDVVLNDPGTRISMRRTVPRDRFAAAWAGSYHTVYLVHPASYPIPVSPHGHW
jgi:hypothetical protein